MATRLLIQIETQRPEDEAILIEELLREIRRARGWEVPDWRRKKRVHIRYQAPRSDVQGDVWRVPSSEKANISFECKARKPEHAAIVAGRFVNFLLRRVGERIQRIGIESR